MTKVRRDQIVLDEKKILSELMINSKENIDTIAKRCGVSKQKVYKTIKNMEKNQIIWGYTPIFDENKMGKQHYILMLKRTSKQLEEEAVDKIISRRAEDILIKLGGTIESSAYVHGEYDWFVTFIADDIKQAKKYSDMLIALHPGEIQKISLMQTLLFIKKQYILNPRREKLKDII
jgi:DNA-binding Lrp family transcriptional regulator